MSSTIVPLAVVPSFVVGLSFAVVDDRLVRILDRMECEVGDDSVSPSIFSVLSIPCSFCLTDVIDRRFNFLDVDLTIFDK